MTAEERLLDAGYEDIVVFSNPGYDDARIGVTTDNQAVYDFDEIVNWLRNYWGFDEDEAIEWIEYNTIRALPYVGDRAPIIIHRI